MRDQHGTVEERAAIAPMRMLGWTLRQIARTLGRAPRTISRELRRHPDPWGGYAGYWAHVDAHRGVSRPCERDHWASTAGRIRPGEPAGAVVARADGPSASAGRPPRSHPADQPSDPRPLDCD